MLSMKCPKCGAELEIPEGLLGQYDTCPDCQQFFRVTRGMTDRADELSRQKDTLADWTPAMGWRIAVTKVGLRLLICTAISAGGIFLVMALIKSLNTDAGRILRFVAMAGLCLGAPQGFIFSAGNMVDKTGISGKALWVLVVAALTLMCGVMSGISVIALGVPQGVAMSFLSSAAVTAMVVSAFRLLPA